MGLTRITAQQISNIDYKQSVRVVAVSNVTLGGGAPVVVDGVSLSAGNRVLVVGQNTSNQNGLYYVATLGTGSDGTWTRTSDGNEVGEIDAGMIIMVTEGTTYADTQWKLTTNDPITVGTTALTFVQNYSANSISSGTSNVVVTSGSNVSIAVAGSNVAVFASTGEYVTGLISATGNITGGNITTAGNLAIPTATANTNTTQAASTAFVVGQAGALTPVTIGTAAIGTSLRYAREDHTHDGVGSAVAGTGISVSGATGAVTFTNSGVTSIVAGTNISVNAATGAVTVSVTGTVPTATTAGTVTTAAQPNITSVGTLTLLNTSGAITVNSGAAATAIVNVATTGVVNIGSSTVLFNTVFAKATSAQYADLAENYVADRTYPVGTVLCIGGDKEVTRSNGFHSTKVIGTVSDNPAYLMNSGLQGEYVVAVAFTGRVPCQVVGKISRGDLLVTSHQEGVATALNSAFYLPGCVIGKALEEYDSNIPGIIEIIIGRF